MQTGNQSSSYGPDFDSALFARVSRRFEHDSVSAPRAQSRPARPARRQKIAPRLPYVSAERCLRGGAFGVGTFGAFTAELACRTREDVFAMCKFYRLEWSPEHIMTLTAKAMEAMLRIKKVDIAGLKRTYAG